MPVIDVYCDHLKKNVSCSTKTIEKPNRRTADGGTYLTIYTSWECIKKCDNLACSQHIDGKETFLANPNKKQD